MDDLKERVACRSAEGADPPQMPSGQLTKEEKEGQALAQFYNYGGTFHLKCQFGWISP